MSLRVPLQHLDRLAAAWLIHVTQASLYFFLAVEDQPLADAKEESELALC